MLPASNQHADKEPMAARKKFVFSPLAWYQTQKHPSLEFFSGFNEERRTGELQRSAWSGRAALSGKELPPRARLVSGTPKALLPLVTFFAITAVMLFVYMCSASIRRRISTGFQERSLAGSSGDKDNEADWCKPPTTSEDPLESLTIPAEGQESTSQRQYEQAEPETVELPHADENLGPNKEQAFTAVITQLERGTAADVSRKPRREGDTDGVPKHFEVQVSLEGIVSVPAPPLDTKLDSPVDPLLSQTTLLGPTLFPDKNEVSEMTEPLSSDSEESEEDIEGFPELPSEPSAYVVAAGEPSSTVGIKRSAASVVSHSQHATSTHLGFVRSVSPESGDAFSPEGWIRHREERALGMPDGAVSGPPNLAPFTGQSDREDLTGGWAAQGASSAELPRFPYLGEASTPDGRSMSTSQGSASGLVPTTQMLGPPDPGLGTSSSASIAGRVSSETSAFTFEMTILPEGVAQATPHARASEQPASSPPPLTVMGIFAAPRWVQAMYPHLPEETLQTHPFYFHPKPHSNLAPRRFRGPVAASFRLLRRFPHDQLEKCRVLLKKEQLTASELKTLLRATERLVGYATGSMPTTVPKKTMVAAIEALGTILLVLDALFCAAEVLGESSRRNSWWTDVVRHIKRVKYSRRVRPSKKNEVAEMLDSALNYYRRCVRPPARFLICVKEVLFEQFCEMKFNSTSWDAWRRDILEWRQATTPEAPTPRNP